MKTTPLICVWTLIALFIVSCEKSELDGILVEGQTISHAKSSISDNRVSLSDIQRIVERSNPQIKSGASSTNQYVIRPYIRNQSDTLLYIINHKNGGWKIYSSDRRTPPVVAEGDSGSFSVDEGSPAVAVWLEGAARDIARVRKSTDSQLAFSEEDIKLNKAFWSGEQPRIVDPNLPIIPEGHWEETVFAQTIVCDTVGHMVAKWDQGDPYNACCPYLTIQSNNRAVAGCVAIAGSQVLLYLHSILGVPTAIPGDGSCIGDIYDFIKSFSDPTDTVWAQIHTNYIDSSPITLKEAVLISKVGALVDMHYCENILDQGDPFSWAFPSNLKTGLFQYYGIDCSRGFYDEDIVKESLLDQMPVIVSATNMMLPLDGRIHCFVIDGYRRTRIKYTHYHYYVYDVIPTGPYIVPEEYETYTYSSPQLTSIKINWGWYTQWDENNPVNDGWYSLTGGWTVINGDNITFDYNYQKYMTYGFGLADN